MRNACQAIHLFKACMQDDLALAVMYDQDKMLLQGVRCLSWVYYEVRNSMYRSLILFSGIHLEGFSALT